MSLWDKKKIVSSVKGSISLWRAEVEISELTALVANWDKKWRKWSLKNNLSEKIGEAQVKSWQTETVRR